MPEVSHITDQMRAAIGVEFDRRVSYPITDSDIRRWALAVYYPEPPPARFIEPPSDGSAMLTPEEFNPFAWASAEAPATAVDLNDADLTEKLLGITPPGLANQLNGGVESEYITPMRSGDVITSVRRVTDYTEREGRLGLMLFTRTEASWTNQQSATVKLTRFTLIRYR